MRADARAPAVLAPAPLTVMLADARAPALPAGAPLAVMRSDARAPAVACAPRNPCIRSCGGYVMNGLLHDPLCHERPAS